jgi:hypothetical protein
MISAGISIISISTSAVAETPKSLLAEYSKESVVTAGSAGALYSTMAASSSVFFGLVRLPFGDRRTRYVMGWFFRP